MVTHNDFAETIGLFVLFLAYLCFIAWLIGLLVNVIKFIMSCFEAVFPRTAKKFITIMAWILVIGGLILTGSCVIGTLSLPFLHYIAK
jgi:hypothetical protein